jgi:hypothetical protein
MNKNSFAVSCDASGLRFVYQVNGEDDKNHGINDSTFDTAGEGRIYQTGNLSCKHEKRLVLIHVYMIV